MKRQKNKGRQEGGGRVLSSAKGRAATRVRCGIKISARDCTIHGVPLYKRSRWINDFHPAERTQLEVVSPPGRLGAFSRTVQRTLEALGVKLYARVARFLRRSCCFRRSFVRRGAFIARDKIQVARRRPPSALSPPR